MRSEKENLKGGSSDLQRLLLDTTRGKKGGTQGCSTIGGGNTKTEAHPAYKEELSQGVRS